MRVRWPACAWGHMRRAVGPPHSGPWSCAPWLSLVQPSLPGAGHLPGSLGASVSCSLGPVDSNLGQPPGVSLPFSGGGEGMGWWWCPLQGLSCHVPASGPSQTTPMAAPNFILRFPVQTGPPCPLESRERQSLLNLSLT